MRRAAGAEIALTNKVVFSREVIERLPELRYIGVTATGYNVVDTAAAGDRGVVVTNVPTYATRSVAQAVLAHVLNGHLQGFSEAEWRQLVDFLQRMVANGEALRQAGTGTGTSTAS